MHATRSRWIAPLIAAMLAASLQTGLSLRLGATLHTFLASVLIATLVVAPMSAITASLGEWTLLVGGVTAGIAAGWLPPTVRAALDGTIAAQCTAILLAWAAAVAGVSRLLTRYQGHPSLGSATTTTLALGWLTAPIWLGIHAPPIIRWHPLFAINLPLRELGLWTEQPIEYRYLFALGQDVPYVLPQTIAPSVVLHAVIGILASAAVFRPLVASSPKPSRRKSAAEDERIST